MNDESYEEYLIRAQEFLELFELRKTKNMKKSDLRREYRQRRAREYGQGIRYGSHDHSKEDYAIFTEYCTVHLARAYWSKISVPGVWPA